MNRLLLTTVALGLFAKMGSTQTSEEIWKDLIDLRAASKEFGSAPKFFGASNTVSVGSSWFIEKSNVILRYRLASVTSKPEGYIVRGNPIPLKKAQRRKTTTGLLGAIGSVLRINIGTTRSSAIVFSADEAFVERLETGPWENDFLRTNATTNTAGATDYSKRLLIGNEFLIVGAVGVTGVTILAYYDSRATAEADLSQITASGNVTANLRYMNDREALLEIKIPGTVYPFARPVRLRDIGIKGVIEGASNFGQINVDLPRYPMFSTRERGRIS